MLGWIIGASGQWSLHGKMIKNQGGSVHSSVHQQVEVFIYRCIGVIDELTNFL